jgi:hypothetical protein
MFIMKTHSLAAAATPGAIEATLATATTPDSAAAALATGDSEAHILSDNVAAEDIDARTTCWPPRDPSGKVTANRSAHLLLLLAGLQAVGQVKGWQAQQIVFVGGACGSVHVESFNKNMKALGVLESKWDPIRQKLVRRLLEEQDKVLRSYIAQKSGARGQRGKGLTAKVGNVSSGTCTCEEGSNSVCGPKLNDQRGVRKG